MLTLYQIFKKNQEQHEVRTVALLQLPVLCITPHPGAQSPPSPGSPDPTCTQSSSSL